MVGDDVYITNPPGSEAFIKDYIQMIEGLETKTNKAIVMGILPRMKERYYNLRRAIGINK